MNDLLNKILESVVEDITPRVIAKVEANLEAKINSAIAEYFKNKPPAEASGSGDIRKVVLELLGDDSEVQNAIEEIVQDAGYIDNDNIDDKVNDVLENVSFDINVRRY